LKCRTREVRLSQDGAENIGLDVNVNTANAAGSTLYATYDGAFTPVSTPVVGATALSSYSTVLSVYPAVDPYQDFQRVAFSPSATGWLTIANQLPIWNANGHPYLGGELTIDCEDQAGRRGAFKVLISKATKGLTPVITQQYSIGGNYAGFPISQIRVSQDDTNALCNVDVNFVGSTGSSCTAYAYFRGFFAPVSSPVVGATALPTVSTVLSAS